MENKNKDKKFSFKALIALSLVVALFVGFGFGYLFFYNTNKEYKKYLEILSLVREQGIEYTTNEYGEQLSSDEVVDVLLNALLDNDEYKEYYTEQEYESVLQENKGSFSNFGISFGYLYEAGVLKDDRLVGRVTGNSPAMKAGIKAGDVLIGAKICTIENESQPIKALANREEIEALLNQTQAGDEVIFRLDRQGEILEISVIKSNYTASYVTYADDEKTISLGAKQSLDYCLGDETMSELPEDVSYIRLDRFSGDAPEQFERALDLAYSNSKGKIILDLRNNGGGSMKALLSIASHLIYNDGNNKTAITVVKSKSALENNKKSKTYSFSKNNCQVDKMQKLVVLANQNSASASECLINALIYYGAENKDANFTAQENLIITKDAFGTAKTYGKGIMQTTFKLKTGGAVKLTTAKVFNPVGENCIHKIGFTTSEENSVTEENALTRALELINQG